MILPLNTNIISKRSTLIQLSCDMYIFIVSNTYKTFIKTGTAEKQRNLVHYMFPGFSKMFETISITEFVQSIKLRKGSSRKTKNKAELITFGCLKRFTESLTKNKQNDLMIICISMWLSTKNKRLKPF